jgi:hypothetical protein
MDTTETITVFKKYETTNHKQSTQIGYVQFELHSSLRGAVQPLVQE